MTAGRGWIALALVVFASWRPLRVLAGAYLFGAVSIGQLHAQALGHRHTVAVAFCASLSGNHRRACSNLAQQATDDDQHTGIARAAVRARSLENTKTGRNPKQERQQRINSDENQISNARSHRGRRSPSAAHGGARPRSRPASSMSAPIGDFGWSYQHDQGALEVQKDLGEQGRDSPISKACRKAPDAERAIERFARSGCNIIFTTSFGFMDATNAVAEKFPDVKFEHATGYKSESPNSRPTIRASTKAATSRARSPPRCRRLASPATSPPSRSRKS